MATSAWAGPKVIRFIPQADLRILDPIATTAGITRHHGYMVYDTLFATDAHFQVHPQMVDKWEVSDKLTYTFTLRDRLKFHDGQPVRSADCIASLQRWGKRDALGQRLAEATASWTPVNDQTFRLKLKKPFPLTLQALGELSSNVPFIMPERIAKTDAFQNITESIGSGPFKFMKEEWVPGNKVVYVKNTEYVPRKEATSWAAGGKVVKVDRVEWLYIPDPATAAAAINAGEADWWEWLPPDLVPVLVKNKDCASRRGTRSAQLARCGSTSCSRRSTTRRCARPCSMPSTRRTTCSAWRATRTTGVPAIPSSPAERRFLPRSARMSLKGKRDLERARKLIQEAGYKGERIVIISATDQPLIHSQSLITHDLLRKLGLNVELQASDWGTVLTRRASKEPVDKNGWSIFHTLFIAPDISSPAAAPLVSSGDKAWFGWPADPKLEELRDAWFAATDPATARKAAEAVQLQAFKFVPYIPTAQVVIPTAYRTSLSGLMVAPVIFFWGVEKK